MGDRSLRFSFMPLPRRDSWVCDNLVENCRHGGIVEEVDTTGVAPTTTMADRKTVLRPDVAEKGDGP